MPAIHRAPSVILLRGATAVGKSTAAVGVTGALERSAVVEVDHLRAVQSKCDWHDRHQHEVALSLAAECAKAFVAQGLLPIVLVDTFGRDHLPDMQRKLDTLGLCHVAFSLWAAPCELFSRSQRRGDSERELAMSTLLNSEVQRVRCLNESLIDTTDMEPPEVVRVILDRSGWLSPEADAVAAAPSELRATGDTML